MDTPSAYTQNYYHAVFSTGGRAGLITPQVEQRLYPFVGGIAQDLKCQLLAINGTADHVHILVRYPPNLSLSDMMRHIKARSSRWVNEAFTGFARFAWQEGYGGFTVSKSAVEKVQAYIERQKEHHQREDFEAEFVELLRRHGIAFDRNDVFQ